MPFSADQPLNAAQVAGLGAGLALMHGREDVPFLRMALEVVLGDPAYRATARRIAGEAAALPPVAEAAADLEAVLQPACA